MVKPDRKIETVGLSRSNADVMQAGRERGDNMPGRKVAGGNDGTILGAKPRAAGGNLARKTVLGG